jgi:hypothetical protein
MAFCANRLFAMIGADDLEAMEAGACAYPN